MKLPFISGKMQDLSGAAEECSKLPIAADKGVQNCPDGQS
ncbi:hypothetical protein LCGC14_3101290, partial [marine sediment metagenome]